MSMNPEVPIVGCVEGWYGRLLDWPDRHALMMAAASAGMNTWWYAPKEDIAHRLAWRESYTTDWREQFSRFCAASCANDVQVIAGMAPGIDIELSGLSNSVDMQCLEDKTRMMLDDGAHVPALLLDDIDPDVSHKLGGFSSEGEAHASLANELGNRLGRALLVVPRIYANELHADSPDYLPAFARTLDTRHVIVMCGSDVVARTVTDADCRQHLTDNEHRIIVWDNFYANDYCPRRLFVGPWRGRDSLQDVVLNTTGMPATDALLFDLFAAQRGRQGQSERSLWRAVLDRHGVPNAFDVVADCFDTPVFNTTVLPEPGETPDLKHRLAALESLTWRWKSSLAREWFPYLMSLRHDLLIESGDLAIDRINKTQLPPLARHLSGSSRKPEAT